MPTKITTTAITATTTYDNTAGEPDCLSVSVARWLCLCLSLSLSLCRLNTGTPSSLDRQFNTIEIWFPLFDFVLPMFNILCIVFIYFAYPNTP